MKTQWTKYKILLGIGLVFVFAGIFLLTFFASDIPIDMYILRPLIVLTFGGIILYQTLIGKRCLFFIFSSLFLCSIGLLFLLIDAKVIPYDLSQIWPVLVIISGILLLFLGYFRYRRFQISYTVLGATFATLGIVFLCFSLDIIKMSFTEFTQNWWPLVFVVFGIGLIVLFVYSQKKGQNFLFDDSDEDEDL